jgi:hypothetical protein
MPTAQKPKLLRMRRFVRQKTSLLLTAFMLGMSNVILEEDRSVHDTSVKIEHQDIQLEND